MFRALQEVPAKYMRFFSIIVLILSADQFTKYLIHSRFRWGESVALIDSVFALTYVRNSGAAFGLLHRAPAYFRDPFFISISLVALVVMGIIYVRLEKTKIWVGMAISLMFSGALGNLLDRLRFGYVIDFLDFHWKEVYHWPAFNVADSCIVVAVGMMVVNSYGQGKMCVSDVSAGGSKKADQKRTFP